MDARPILHRTEDNIWIRASHLRDQLYDAVSQACASEGIDALVLKSGPFVHPAWVKFEAWVPAGKTVEVTSRISATVAIHPRPYHTFEFAYALEMQGREDADKKKSRLLTKFGAEEACRVVRFLLRREPKPLFLDLEFREKWYQFWKPKNRVATLRRDKAQIWVALVFAAGILTLSVYGIGFLVIIVAFVLQKRLARRPRLVRADGKPKAEPRSLVRVDSWQAMIFGAGDAQASLRERFLGALGSPPSDKFRSRAERIWHWGLDGKEEREQLVLWMGRGIAFCHIYSYGKDLYIGWDAHLNTGQWVEVTLAQGLDRETGKLSSVNSVEPGTQAVSEYDIVDCSCLIEWTHAQITQLVKQFMEERKVDQEIDFKILRGERQTLPGRGQPQQATPLKLAQRWFRKA